MSLTPDGVTAYYALAFWLLVPAWTIGTALYFWLDWRRNRKDREDATRTSEAEGDTETAEAIRQEWQKVKAKYEAQTCENQGLPSQA